MRLVLVELPLCASPGADNWERVRRRLEAGHLALQPDDVVVLPEAVDPEEDGGRYEAAVCDLARGLGCHVIGGSHHERRGHAKVNTGVAASPAGAILSRYEKLRPYGEARTGVTPGSMPGELTIAGRRLLIVICADFWFSNVLQRARELPHVIVVPACSVTRKPSPRFARALWRHMAVSRAYEFGAFVGISDWARSSEIPRAPGAVAGFADPTTTDPAAFFRRVGPSGLHAEPLDFAALDSLRADRRARGFLEAPRQAGRPRGPRVPD